MAGPLESLNLGTVQTGTNHIDLSQQLSRLQPRYLQLPTYLPTYLPTLPDMCLPILLPYLTYLSYLCKRYVFTAVGR